ncbi:MAG: FG-GAP-like repeat-containing protein [Imperialibacter sp.]|uniref:leucine-rich repeat domain-containing protein n=1 Tax=Imperialibacter sp. TaxID=2038411 RepID=UPI0032EF0433
MLTKPNTPKTKYAFLAVVSAVFFLLLISKPSQVKAQVLAADSLALVDLYNATNGASWGNNINWTTGAVPTWNGITVVGNRVTQVDLNTNNLVGTIPTSIGDLTALTNLNLGGNMLSGSLPTEIGTLTALVDFQLWDNQLSGSLPTSIGNLTNLTYLDLAPNQFSGTIPTEIGNLVNLGTLWLNHNQFVGAVPGSLVNLTALTALYLQENSLTDLPDLSALVGLTTFEVDGNIFTFEDLEPNSAIITGSPTQQEFGITQYIHLQTGSPLLFDPPLPGAGASDAYQWQRIIDIPGANAATYSIPSATVGDGGTYVLNVTNSVFPGLTISSKPIIVYQSVNAADSLALVDLYNSTDGGNWINNANWLTGDVATWYGVTVAGDRVTQISLNANNIIGLLPPSIGDLSALLDLYLEGNGIYGSLPVEIANLVTITTFDLSNNSLSGSLIPVGSLFTVAILDIASNNFEGAVPAEIGDLTGLTYLDISDNNLSGVLPDELGNIGSSLANLYLNHNSFSGSVPAAWSSLTGLVNVALNANDFDALPDFTLDWISIGTLDVTQNKLQFGDLEPYEPLGPGFSYDPQQNLGTVNPTEFFLQDGDPFTFTVPVQSGTGVTYQWTLDGVDIPGANSNTYSIGAFTTATDAGEYIVNIDHPTLAVTISSFPKTLRSKAETLFFLDETNTIFADSIPNETYAQAWADFDQDGDEDLFIGAGFTGPGTPNRLYQNNGDGTFTSISAGDLTTDLLDPRSASWGDINNDGYPDIFVGDLGYRSDAPPTIDVKVYLNNQNNTFTGLTLPAVANLDNTEGGVWGDYDGDGFIDLAVWGSANVSSPITLFKNNGNNTFTEVVGAFGVNLAQLATASWEDVDNNGTLDFFISYLTGRLYFQNNGDGTFTQNLSSPIVTQPVLGTRGHSWGDIDNDGDQDLFLFGGQGAGDTQLFTNNGAGNFTVSDDFTFAGLDINTRGATLGDIDNDGDLDLITLTPAIEPPVFLNNGAGSFTKLDALQQTLYKYYQFYAVTLADFNNDGFLDMLNIDRNVGSDGQLETNIPRGYLNVGNANNWLKVKLAGSISNAEGIGAKITLQYSAGAQSRVVKTGSGYAGQNSVIQHFGLGAQTAITSVTVNWPSGNTDVILNPGVNQLLTVTENSTVPKGLLAGTKSENSIELKWTPYQFANGGSLYLERATSDAGPFLTVGILSDTITSYSDVGLFANTVYYYRLKHENGLTVSAYSPTIVTATFSTGLPDTWNIQQAFTTPGRLTLLDMAVDSLGNTYLAGNFAGTLFLNGDSIYSNGANDAIVIKVNSTKTIDWIKTFGGLAVDLAVDVAIGPGGSIYVGGYHRGAFTVDSQSAPAPVGGAQDGYVARLSPDGTVTWITTLGSPGDAIVNKLAVDAAGNAYLAGYFNGDFTFGGTALTGGGPGLFKVGSDGSKIFARFGTLVGNTRFVNDFLSVSVSGSNVYVTGQVDGQWSFEGTPITPNALRDAVLVNYGTDGSLKWVKTMAGPGEDFGNEVVVDAAGNVFWTGDFDGATATVDAVSVTNSGTGYDIYLAKVNGSDGTVLWGKSAGTPNENDIPYSLATDGNSAFVAGTMGYGATSFDASTLSNGKLFIASYGTDGAVRWVDKSEGSFGLPWGLEYSPVDQGIVMTGSFEYTQRFGVTDLIDNGNRNGFLVFHNDSGLPIPAAPGAFQAFATFDDSISAKWAAVPGIASYSLERADDFIGPYSQIASLPDSVLTYSDPSVASGETYYYRLRSLQGVYSDYTYTEEVFTFSNSLADSWDNTKFFKGRGRENFLDVVTDASGSSYLVGYATDTTTFGALQVTSKGAHDLLAVKLDSLGSPVWAKSFGSTGTDILEGVQIDGQGSVYVTGYYNGAMTIGADSLPALGHTDMITIKLNAANGDVIWAKPAGGTGDSGGLSVAVDSAGNVFVAGYFNGSLTHGATTLTGGGHALLKYDATGAPLLALQGALVSAQTDFVNQFQRVKANNSGVYVLGQYSNDWTFGGLPATGIGGTDLFVAHYDLAGNIRWLRSIGGTGDDEARDIALDANGDVLVLAFPKSTSISIDTITVSQNGQLNLIAKLNGNTGAGIWGKTFGTPQGSDYPYKIAADPTGFFVAGAMDIEPTQFGGPVVNGGLLYLASFDTNGTIKWADAGEGELYSWAMNYSAYHNAAVVAGGVHFNAQIGSAKFEGVEERDLFFSMHGQSATPLAPAISRAVAANTTSAYIEWTPVVDASSYLVQAKLSGATAFSNIKVVPSDTSQVLIKSLLPDSVYNVRVVAYGQSVSQSAVSASANVTMSCGALPLTDGDYLVKYGARKRDGVVIPSEESYAAIYSTAPGTYVINGLTGGYYKKYFGSATVIDTLSRACNVVSKPSLTDPTGILASVSSVVYAPDTLWMEYKTASGDWLNLRFFKTASQMDSADLAAIVKLYDTTGGDTWTDKTNWKSALPVGFWHGIKTSNGRVVEIDLPGNNLIGELPAELFDMDSLRILNLGANQLTGTIPSSITGMKGLEMLYLNDNQLSGEIPDDIGLLQSLNALDLGRNQLIGGLPESIGNLTKLESIFGVMGNQLEGIIPPTIGNLNKLKILALDANQFDGSVPAEIGNMTSLEALYLHQNKLTGSLPDSIAKLKSLKSLYLFDNQLEGSVPASVATMDSLQILILQQNQFTFVPNLTGLASLDTLNISNNKVGFGSIEPNLAVNGFVYSPQGRFGLPLDTLHSAGDAFLFELEMGGSTNSYQWFKDDAEIAGAVEQDYFIASTTEDSEGTYFARVANASVPDLVLDTDEYVLKISSRKRDSLALVAIYEGTDGPNWVNKTNWLQGELSTWGGVTLKNGRVSQLNLPNNRMVGPMSAAIRDIGELAVINLSNSAPSFDPAIDNQIRFLPDLKRLDSLTSVDLTRNRLGFVSIETNLAALGDKFLFSPQRRFGETRYDSVPVGQAHKVAIEVSGLTNNYQWYFNDQPIEGATRRFHIIDNVTYDKMGAYFVEVKSPKVPDFSIRNRNQNVLATTTISGSINSAFDQSPLTSGVAIVYKIKDGPYDSIAAAQVSPEGAFIAEKIVLGDYIIIAKPDLELFPDALQTYYSSTIDWVQADTLRVRNPVSGLAIGLLGTPPPLNGDGVITGGVDSDLPDSVFTDEEARILDRKRVAGAGVSLSRQRFRAKGNEFDYDFVAYTVTDEEGNFSFGTLPDDTYLINIQYPGVPMDQSSDILLTLGTETDLNEISVAALVTPEGIVVDKVAVKGIAAPFIRDLNVYPNPGEDIISLDYFVRRKVESLNLRVTDVTGRELMLQALPFSHGPQRTAMDISGLTPGMYILVISDEAGSFTETWRIQKK